MVRKFNELIPQKCQIWMLFGEKPSKPFLNYAKGAGI